MSPCVQPIGPQRKKTTMTENVMTPCSADRGTTANAQRLLPVDLLTAQVADALARLWNPAQLRRALGYAGPVLPVLAQAVGIGGAGQVLLTVMLRLAERALEDSHESSERAD